MKNKKNAKKVKSKKTLAVLQENTNSFIQGTLTGKK